LRYPPVRLVGRIVTHPVFCWLASTAAVIGWHVPVLFALGMRSERFHEVEHACFFVAGLLFWLPVVQPWPSLARWPQWSVPLYLFLATLPCDALSAFLTFCNRVVYPQYLSAHRLFDISPLGDQEFAGALMWVWVTLAYLAPAAAVTIQMLSPNGRSLKAEVV
jgi:cytochrome c oxidase assembly factor CtaG